MPTEIDNLQNRLDIAIVNMHYGNYKMHEKAGKLWAEIIIALKTDDIPKAKRLADAAVKQLEDMAKGA